MSLTPSTDLVLEVSHAADPARAAAVADRLKALSAQGASDTPANFATALNAAAGEATTVSNLPIKAMGAKPSASKAETKLESVFLTQFIGEMLPKDTPNAFGQGYAGDMWRSMLAERVADQMAASGRLGIASKLFSTHAFAGSQHMQTPDKAHGVNHANATLTSANALSAPQGADIESGAVLFSRVKSL